MDYPNFYETVKEANDRLKNTVVLYDGYPYLVLAVTDHKSDNKFRIYLDKTPGKGRENPQEAHSNPTIFIVNYQWNHPTLGQDLDDWIEKYPNRIIRKDMNSIHFNKFKPFPLGMVNEGAKTFYVERQPTRPRMEQGLTQSSLSITPISAGGNLLNNGGNKAYPSAAVEYTSEAMWDCILGEYPTPSECLDGLLNEDYIDDAKAFSRDFALIAGPIGIIFLAYKTDIVGLLPKSNFEFLRLGRDFLHTKEVIERLGLFNTVAF